MKFGCTEFQRSTARIFQMDSEYCFVPVLKVPGGADILCGGGPEGLSDNRHIRTLLMMMELYRLSGAWEPKYSLFSTSITYCIVDKDTGSTGHSQLFNMSWRSKYNETPTQYINGSVLHFPRELLRKGRNGILSSIQSQKHLGIFLNLLNSNSSCDMRLPQVRA